MGKYLQATNGVHAPIPVSTSHRGHGVRVNFPERPLEALIRIPENAQINEPWATDGKASADKIEILQVYDVATGKDVTGGI